jgi:hypothetical protein
MLAAPQTACLNSRAQWGMLDSAKRHCHHKSAPGTSDYETVLGKLGLDPA